MKTIIVPIDYSPAAENAAMYAVHLAAATGCSLLLLNAYELPVNTNEMPAMLVPVDDLEHNAMQQLKNLKEKLLLQQPQLSIEITSRLGDVVAELEDVCKEAPPFAVVTGHHQGDALDRLIEGNPALSIIRSISQPVLVIPDRFTSFRMQNIVIAADKNVTDEQTQTAAGIAAATGASLQNICIRVGDEEVNMPGTCTIVEAESFIEGIQAYLTDHAVDLIIVFPHDHNFIERLFYTSHTEELVNKIEVPVLCLR